jgi:hypothetical protein
MMAPSGSVTEAISLPPPTSRTGSSAARDGQR